MQKCMVCKREFPTDQLEIIRNQNNGIVIIWCRKCKDEDQRRRAFMSRPFIRLVR